MAEFGFKDSELAIKTETASYRIKAWPEPSARKLGKDGNWKEFRPEFRLIRPPIKSSGSAAGDRSAAPSGREIQSADTHNRKQRAFSSFRSQLPQNIAAAIEEFGSHQWNLLDLLSKEKAAQELAENNPILAWCLANNDQFRRFRLASSPAVRALPVVNRRQAAITQWLGFPASDSMVRLMRKILPKSITPLDARLLRQVVTDPRAARLLAHLRSINAGVLGLVCNFKLLPAVTPSLLIEVAGEEEEMDRQPTADLLIDALYLMTIAQIHLRIPEFGSIRAIREFHESVVAESQRKREEIRAKAREKKRKKNTAPRPFPEPPVPGTTDILPLTSEEELKKEGLQQRNCVGSFVRRVKSGNIYIYKVLRPQRATLAITLGPDGFWRRSEMLLARNRPAAWSAKVVVDRWLGQYSLSI